MSTLAEWVVEVNAAGMPALRDMLNSMQEQLKRNDETIRQSAGSMANSVAQAHQQAAMAQARGQEAVAKEYQHLAAVGEIVQRAFQSGAIDAVLAQKKIQAATNETALALIRQQKAEQDAARAAQQTHLQRMIGMNALASAYNTVSGTILGFVRAGLQGTAQGNQISLQMQFISREIANLFLPLINRVVETMQRVTLWFRGLSGAQQENIGRWAAFTVAGLGAAAMLPRVAAGIQLVGAAMKAAIAGNPIGLILVAATAVVGLLASTDKGQAALMKLGRIATNVLGPVLERVAASLQVIADRFGDIADRLPDYINSLDSRIPGGGQGRGANLIMDALVGNSRTTNIWWSAMTGMFGQFLAPGGGTGAREGSARGRNELQPAGGGFESVQETFRRLQTAVNRTDIPQRQLTELQQIRQNTDPNRRRNEGLFSGFLQGATPWAVGD